MVVTLLLFYFIVYFNFLNTLKFTVFYLIGLLISNIYKSLFLWMSANFYIVSLTCAFLQQLQLSIHLQEWLRE